MYALFCCILFLCPNPSHYFPLLSLCAHLSSFNRQYETSSFISFCKHLYSFNRSYKTSSLRFHSTRSRLEHHHCHHSSSCRSFKFMQVIHVLYLMLPTFFSFIFFFNSSPSSSLFLISVFTICFSLCSFLSFLLKKIFCSSPHLHLPIFFLNNFAFFL